MFKLSLSAQKRLPKRIQQAWVSSSKPIFFRRARIKNQPGVVARVQHSTYQRAYFYPASVIEEKIVDRGGREGYVYREGFDPQWTLQHLAATIQNEIPAWNPRVREASLFPLNALLVSQPGVDMWRMLCFALDHGPGLRNTSSPEKFILSGETFPSFGVRASGLNFETVLYSGNHRCLFAYAHRLFEIPLVTVNVSGLAFNFGSNLRRMVEHVEEALGSRGISALAQSFIRQVEEQG
jgi:hypothetical protein